MNIENILMERNYKKEHNIYKFIESNNKPFWSMQLDKYFDGKEFSVEKRYYQSKEKYEDNKAMQEYFKLITDTKGIIIDLASGPSGYFGTVLDDLNQESTFIITDASDTIVKAHSIANTKKKCISF